MKQVIYTASPESQEIHVWSLAEDGALSLKQRVKTAGQAQPLCINRHRNLLYAGIKPDFHLATWQIAPDGALSYLGKTPLPGSATYLATDRHDNALYVAYYHDGLVSYSPLNEQGLPMAPTQVISGLEGCHSVNISLDNRRLYAPALKQDRICVYPLLADQRLDEAQGQQLTSGSGAGPRHMAFHPQGSYAYVINELDSKIAVIRLGEQQEIIQTIDTQPADFTGTRWAADIHLTPNGQFLYSCDRSSSLLTLFHVSPEGDQLSLIGFQPTESQPRGFTLDAQGQYLFATGQKSHHLTQYRIDQSNGKLQQMARYEAGKGPMWAVAHCLN